MSQVLDEFQQIITESNIPPQDQNDILVVLPVLPEKAISVLNDIFKSDPKFITEFNKSFKAKVRALTNQDDKEWEEILQKERDQAGEMGMDNGESLDADNGENQDSNY